MSEGHWSHPPDRPGFLGGSLSRHFAVVLLALLIPIAAVTYSVREGLFSNARELIDTLRVGGLAERSRGLILIQDDVTKELFLDPSAIELAERKISAYDQNLAILQELRALSSSPELDSIVEQMIALEAQIRPLDTQILEVLLAGKAGDVGRARELYFGRYREIRREFEELSVAMAALSEELAREAEARMRERNRATVLQAGGALLAGMAAVAVLIVRLSRRIGRRTAAMLDVLEDVAEGDLRRTPTDQSPDELGRIATALSVAIQGMRGTMMYVSESLDLVRNETSAIHGLSNDVSGAAGEQIGGIDSVVTAVASVTADAEGLALSADVLAEAAGHSSESVEQLQHGSEELRTSGASLGGVVDGVSGAVSQLLDSLDKVMSYTEDLARAAISTTKGSQRLVRSFRTIDENAAETERRSAEVVHVVERGCDGMERTIAGMTAIREATDEADEAIVLLTERAKEIDEIIDVITAVGDKTSLLALNAAILATRAGDRAFMVVAGEIKTLAGSVLTHTREVTNRIAAVQTQAARVADAIHRGSERVRTGEELSREAGQNLEAIRAAAAESGTRMQQVVEAVRQESHSVEEMARLASTLDAAVAQIRVALGEQRRGTGVVRDAARETSEIATQLRQRSEAQLRGTGAIADGVEKVLRSSEQIRAAVRAQRESFARVTETLEGVAAGGRRNEASASSVRDRLASLDREAEELGERVRWFKT
jgi:methyl-accepting chemotaxis protein